MHDETEFDDYEDDYKSKTQIKQEMLALQDLGVAITELSKDQIAQLPLGETLHKAITDSAKITQRSARKRHFQYIGKLMRSADIEAIEAQYNAIQAKQHQATQRLHIVERWRDELIREGDAKLNQFFEEYSGGDRQQFRQLIRSAQKEASQQKPPASARKLFKLIREQVDQ